MARKGADALPRVLGSLSPADAVLVHQAIQKICDQLRPVLVIGEERRKVTIQLREKYGLILAKLDACYRD